MELLVDPVQLTPIRNPKIVVNQLAGLTKRYRELTRERRNVECSDSSRFKSIRNSYRNMEIPTPEIENSELDQTWDGIEDVEELIEQETHLWKRPKMDEKEQTEFILEGLLNDDLEIDQVKTDLARNILEIIASQRSRKEITNELFLPGRMTYLVNLEEDIPEVTIVILTNKENDKEPKNVVEEDIEVNAPENDDNEEIIEEIEDFEEIQEFEYESNEIINENCENESRELSFKSDGFSFYELVALVNKDKYCKICSYPIFKNTKLNHFNSRHKVKMYKCEIETCNSYFDYEFELLSHDYEMHQKSTICKNCSIEFPSVHYLHLHLDEGVCSNVVCQYCVTVFDRPYFLSKHLLCCKTRKKFENT